MKIFKVHVKCEATYFVKDENDEYTPEDAEFIAENWFAERRPDFYTEELEPSSFPAVDAYC